MKLDKYINKGYIIIIGILILTLFGTYTGWRKSVTENKTLRKALENPTVIEKPKIIYKELPPRIITKTVVVEKDKTTTTEKTEYNGTEIEINKDEGSISKAEVPNLPKNDVRRFSLIGTYSLEQNYGLGFTYRIFQAIPIELGAGFHSEDKAQAIAVLRF